MHPSSSHRTRRARSMVLSLTKSTRIQSRVEHSERHQALTCTVRELLLREVDERSLEEAGYQFMPKLSGEAGVRQSCMTTGRVAICRSAVRAYPPASLLRPSCHLSRNPIFTSCPRPSPATSPNQPSCPHSPAHLLRTHPLVIQPSPAIAHCATHPASQQ